MIPRMPPVFWRYRDHKNRMDEQPGNIVSSLRAAGANKDRDAGLRFAVLNHYCKDTQSAFTRLWLRCSNETKVSFSIQYI